MALTVLNANTGVLATGYGSGAALTIQGPCTILHIELNAYSQSVPCTAMIFFYAKGSSKYPDTGAICLMDGEVSGQERIYYAKSIKVPIRQRVTIVGAVDRVDSTDYDVWALVETS